MVNIVSNYKKISIIFFLQQNGAPISVKGPISQTPLSVSTPPRPLLPPPGLQMQSFRQQIPRLATATNGQHTPKNSFEKLIQRLITAFPQYSRYIYIPSGFRNKYHKEDCVFSAHAHVAVALSVLAITCCNIFTIVQITRHFLIFLFFSNSLIKDVLFSFNILTAETIGPIFNVHLVGLEINDTFSFFLWLKLTIKEHQWL
jgi:hypothetical protein